MPIPGSRPAYAAGGSPLLHRPQVEVELEGVVAAAAERRRPMAGTGSRQPPQSLGRRRIALEPGPAQEAVTGAVITRPVPMWEAVRSVSADEAPTPHAGLPRGLDRLLDLQAVDLAVDRLRSRLAALE